ncbi:MAG: hypothetical protein OET79_09410, partial [Nitrospirota bacterium]|nr:hypothetical protein [Nitrospirota bacterium]
LLDIDLGGPKPAALVADVITRLALDDVETDDVLLLSLRFRNGNLGGALELRDLSLPFALEFGEAESDSTSSDDLTFEGLIFENMTFEKKVVFSNVSWSDEVFIDRSTFEQGLSIKYSTLTSPDDKDPRKILINKSFIEHDFHLLHLTVKGKLLLYDNTISPAFQIEDSSMRHGTILRDNDFADFMIHGGTNYSITGINLNNVDRFELKNSWFAEIQIGQNNISSELVIDDVTWDREFELTANTIGEEFYFKPKHVGYSAKNGSVINLVANSVGGVASIAIPANDLDLRPIHVDLSSSSFQGRLNVGLTPPFDMVDEAATSEANAREERYCYYETRPSKGLTVDLSSATAKRFAWNLPFGDCSYRWFGSGFRYDEWLGDPRKHEIVSPYKSVDDLKNWQYQISDAQPSALIFMSDYLRAQGRFTASRSALFDAKRMDYEPHARCETMQLWQIRFWTELWTPRTFPKNWPPERRER